MLNYIEHGLINKGTIDWEIWCTYEHVPERLAIPLFLGGHRYMNNSYKNRIVYYFSSTNFEA